MARTKCWKDALYPGVWVTTKGQVFQCGAADLKHFHDRTKAMLQNGACIPWCFEHQHDDADTIGLSASDLLARWAKNTGGHIHDVRQATDGHLEVLMDVDDADKPKLESIKFCSADIRNNWRDRHGPAFDKTGPYWPGQSIAHLAVTPMPVQYPQEPFNFAQQVSLSAAGVDVSLSSASYKPAKKTTEDDAMAFPPKKKDDDSAPEEITPPADGEAGEDFEPGEPPAIDPSLDSTKETEVEETEEGAGMGAEAGAAIAQLTQNMAKIGIKFHASASDSLLNFVQHLNTAFDSHLSTKAGGEAEADPNQPDPNQPDPNPNNEAEYSESAPIMMSAAPTEREIKLTARILKDTRKDLTNRLNVLHARGFIDDKMKAEQVQKLGAIQLSASDVNDDGDVKPNEVSIWVSAFERQMQSGKPGPFGNKAPAKPAANPHKPISSTIALSNATQEHVVSPDSGEEPSGDGELIPEVLDAMTGGRYSEYAKAQSKA